MPFKSTKSHKTQNTKYEACFGCHPHQSACTSLVIFSEAVSTLGCGNIAGTVNSPVVSVPSCLFELFVDSANPPLLTEGIGLVFFRYLDAVVSSLNSGCRTKLYLMNIPVSSSDRGEQTGKRHRDEHTFWCQTPRTKGQLVR